MARKAFSIRRLLPFGSIEFLLKIQCFNIYRVHFHVKAVLIISLLICEYHSVILVVLVAEIYIFRSSYSFYWGMLSDGNFLCLCL